MSTDNVIEEKNSQQDQQQIYNTIFKFEEFLLSGQLQYLCKTPKEKVKCWEINNCTKKRCPAYGITSIRCWHKTGVFCKLTDAQKNTHLKFADCRDCPTFKNATPTLEHRVLEAVSNIFYQLSTINNDILTITKISHDDFNLLSRKYLLTPREGEVMLLLLEGMSRNQMAKTLGLSSETIKVHTKKLYRKVEVNSKTELKETLINWQKDNKKVLSNFL